MALSDLAVYSEYAYAAATEVLDQQIEVFNAASQGTITISPSAVQGDWYETAFYAKIDGLVRRRNAYGTGAIGERNMRHLTDTRVKVAAGTQVVNLDPGQFAWIQRSPEEAGALMGQQLAKDMFADFLNVSLGATVAALGQETEIVYDATTTTDTAPSFRNLNHAASLFGDRSSAIQAWIMHSTPMHLLWDNALTNVERLFVYGTVNVMRDPMGRVFVITDSPYLLKSDGTQHTLGLTQNAIIVQQGNDYFANEEVKNGQENIARTFQAEWSWTLGINGFSWDKATGGASPTDAALLVSSNWDRYSTSHKDLAGVLLNTK